MRQLGSGALSWTLAAIVAAEDLPYSAMAARIVSALQVSAGERVLVRYDPTRFAPLGPELRKALTAAGAKVEALPYGPAPTLAERLGTADIYIWLPGDDAGTPADQRELLARWLDEGKGRQIHFHWHGGTVGTDGLPGVHSSAYDRVYADALDIDYPGLRATMDRVIARLRAGDAVVTTPAGTNIRFRVGDRPFNKQDGDGSRGRMASARIRLDREIELPAGVLRVAPIEESVDGVIVVPSGRFGDGRAQGVRLTFERGKVVAAKADTGEAELNAFLDSGPGARQFREFGLGFNPKLVVPPGERWLPYYGYGAGVVRLSLGDNTELGGSARGGPIRWLFFPDASVTVGAEKLVENGRLMLQ